MDYNLHAVNRRYLIMVSAAYREKSILLGMARCGDISCTAKESYPLDRQPFTYQLARVEGRPFSHESLGRDFTSTLLTSP